MSFNTHRGTVVKRIGPKPCKARPVSDVLPSGAWRGERCVILGGGPSLEGFDFGVLDGIHTIGINKMFQLYPSEVHYSMDHTFFEMVELNRKPSQDHYELHREWSQYDGIKVFMRAQRQVFNENVYVVQDLGKKAVSLDLGVGIYKGNNSGCGALMLAVALGCTQIGLLGYDFKVIENGNAVKTHCHEGYDRGTIRSLLPNLENFRNCIEEIGPCLGAMGISVFNLNPDSALQCFEKRSWGGFLSGV